MLVLSLFTGAGLLDQAFREKGFVDNHKSERGNLFFNIVDIIEAKKNQKRFS